MIWNASCDGKWSLRGECSCPNLFIFRLVWFVVAMHVCCSWDCLIDCRVGLRFTTGRGGGGGWFQILETTSYVSWRRFSSWLGRRQLARGWPHDVRLQAYRRRSCIRQRFRVSCLCDELPSEGNVVWVMTTLHESQSWWKHLMARGLLEVRLGINAGSKHQHVCLFDSEHRFVSELCL